MSQTMDTSQFDKAVVAALFNRAALVGWRDAGLVEAAREAGLDLARLRVRFPGRHAVLLRFGVQMDQAVLEAAHGAGSHRDRLFDLVMVRFDQLQLHRAGVLALLRDLPFDPAAAALLAGATMRSMRWMLEAAGIPTGGLRGLLRVQGMVALWTYTLRAWQADEGADLSATMAALDRALDRAMQAEASLAGPAGEAGGDAPAHAAEAAPPIVSGTAIAAAEDGPAVI